MRPQLVEPVAVDDLLIGLVLVQDAERHPSRPVGVGLCRELAQDGLGDVGVLVVAASLPGAARYGTGSAPSVWVTGGSSVGTAADDPATSFGAVAEGDMIFDETRACPLAARGAFSPASCQRP